MLRLQINVSITLLLISACSPSICYAFFSSDSTSFSLPVFITSIFASGGILSANCRSKARPAELDGSQVTPSFVASSNASTIRSSSTS